MSDCCASSQKHPCPKCQIMASKVATQTINFHLKKPWQWQPLAESYYFCPHAQCSVVYFSDSEIINTTNIKTKIACKTNDLNKTICYCYGITQSQMNQETKDYVIAQTKNKSCQCVTHNPSGRCCLKSFSTEQTIY